MERKCYDGQTSGYHFKQPDGTEILTTAVDLTSANETPTGYIAGDRRPVRLVAALRAAARRHDLEQLTLAP